jgi:hypothetical protein
MKYLLAAAFLLLACAPPAASQNALQKLHEHNRRLDVARHNQHFWDIIYAQGDRCGNGFCASGYPGKGSDIVPSAITPDQWAAFFDDVHQPVPPLPPRAKQP